MIGCQFAFTCPQKREFDNTKSNEVGNVKQNGRERVMKKFMMTLVAIAGISVIGFAGTADAGHGHGGHGRSHSGYRGGHGGWGHGHHHHHHHGHRGYPVAPRYGYGYPVYTAPVIPVYGGAPYYGGYGGTSFGITTPNFGLFVR